MARSDLAVEQREDEALSWFRRLHLAEPSAVDRQAFEHWCARDPANRSTYERAQGVWQELGHLEDLPDARAILEEAASLAAMPERVPLSFMRFRTTLGLAASLLIAAILSFLYLNAPTRYSTTTAEIRSLNLPDGSRVTLGARSRIRLQFDDATRRLHLDGGEAFFEVRRDPSRPFVVDIGNARVRVLGTKFDVRRGTNQVNIAVLEGTVEVVPSQSDQKLASAKYLLNAGQQLTAGNALTGAHTQPTNATAPPGAWRNGRHSYDGARLADVLADVNRYFPAGVSLASANLADLKVTTAFNVDQIDLMINSLTTALPLAAQREPDGHVVLRSRPDPK